MRKALGVFPFLLAFGILAADGAQISGIVEILDKGDVKRNVIRDVIVYVEELQAPILASAGAQRFTMHSEKKAFVPHVKAVPIGAMVSFPNLDGIMHNVFSLSRGNRFDLGLYKSGASKDYRFENAALVRVYCNIHPQMSAFILVRDNPYFTETRPDGSFRIENVPPGSYTVRAWHEKAQATLEVTVPEAGASGVSFLLDTRRFKRKAHLNKFGKRYKRKRGKY